MSAQPRDSTPDKPSGRKPDALSHQFQEKEDAISEHVLILSAHGMVATLTWEIEERVRSAIEDQPGPSSVPRGCLFLLPALRSDASFPWPRRQLNWSCSMFSGSMGSLLMWCLIGALSSLQFFGRNSVLCLEPPSVCPSGFIPSLMVRTSA